MRGPPEDQDNKTDKTSIDESKIDGLSFQVSFIPLHQTGTNYPRSELRRIGDVGEQGNVDTGNLCWKMRVMICFHCGGIRTGACHVLDRQPGARHVYIALLFIFPIPTIVCTVQETCSLLCLLASVVYCPLAGMRFPQAFMRLPSTLLVVSLALTASALPVESTQLKVLTPDDFQETIAHGVWYVKFVTLMLSILQGSDSTFTNSNPGSSNIFLLTVAIAANLHPLGPS